METPKRIDGLFAKWAEHGKIGKPRSALECVTVGMQLLMVKEATPHGMFSDRVNSLGFKKSAAAEYMACARRFDPGRHAPLLAAVAASSKLVELLCLSDEELALLNRGGVARNLTGESISSMTVVQLRKALGKKTVQIALTLAPDEELLLRNYRKCNADAKAHVAKAAELLAPTTEPTIKRN